MSRPFIAILPQPLKNGDKILLKGYVKPDAYEYSINFATGTGPEPEDIAYHFKSVLPENLVVENIKRNGEWYDEIIKDWPAPDGNGFSLEFAFTDGFVYTYLVEDVTSRNLCTYYELDCDLKSIDSVQVWGDVERVIELTFRYSQ